MQKPKNSIIGGLATVILAVVGMASWWGDNSLVKYHNGFVQGAYREVLVDSWGKLVEAINSETTKDADVIAALKNSFVPVTKKWAEQAKNEVPPQFAETFHDKYTADLVMLSKDAEKLLQAFEEKDSPNAKLILQDTNKVTDGMIDRVIKFQELLQKERKFTFENEGKDKK